MEPNQCGQQRTKPTGRLLIHLIKSFSPFRAVNNLTFMEKKYVCIRFRSQHECKELCLRSTAFCWGLSWSTWFPEPFWLFYTSLLHHLQPHIFPQFHTLIVTIGFLHWFKGFILEGSVLLCCSQNTIRPWPAVNACIWGPQRSMSRGCFAILVGETPFHSAREQKWSQPDANGTKRVCVTSEAMEGRSGKALENTYEEGGHVRGPISPFFFSICCFSYSSHPLCVTV